jgi:pleiotropic regulator 1
MGKTLTTLTRFKHGVRSLTISPKEFTFAGSSTGSIKQFKCPEGSLMANFDGHSSIINTLSVSEDDVLFSGGDDGSMRFWDWKSAHCFQQTASTAQPGSLEAENGIFASIFDKSYTRLILGGADKSISMWGRDESATEETHPLDWKPTLGGRVI